MATVKAAKPKLKSFTRIPAAKKVASTIAGMSMKAPKQVAVKFKAPGNASTGKIPNIKMPKVSTNGGSKPPRQSLSKNNILNGLK